MVKGLSLKIGRFLFGPDVMESIWGRTWHKIFECRTFWSVRPKFRCPECKRGIRCYFDGNDCNCGKTDICNGCYARHHVDHVNSAIGRVSS